MTQMRFPAFNTEIARQFGISPITVNKHIAVTCAKLNAAIRTATGRAKHGKIPASWRRDFKR